jgi:hypothetical protein
MVRIPRCTIHLEPLFYRGAMAVLASAWSLQHG